VFAHFRDGLIVEAWEIADIKFAAPPTRHCGLDVSVRRAPPLGLTHPFEESVERRASFDRPAHLPRSGNDSRQWSGDSLGGIHIAPLPSMRGSR